MHKIIVCVCTYTTCVRDAIMTSCMHAYDISQLANVASWHEREIDPKTLCTRTLPDALCLLLFGAIVE